MAQYRSLLWPALISVLVAWAVTGSIFLTVFYSRMASSEEKLRDLQSEVVVHENQIIGLADTQSQTVDALGSVVDNQHQMVKLLRTVQGG